tara:strand:- start:1736 stop:2473 length:738 start_codon:yes stop_codon:yes gene_type:complete
MSFKTSSIVGVLMSIAVAGVGQSAESKWEMDMMSPDLSNTQSLQNGFKIYVNYCLGCHSLQYQRYERTADDLELPHEVVVDNLIFTDQKIGELMTSSMDPGKAKDWFGAPPPDLTMVTRVRSSEWLYNYLRTFYIDESRPFGVNNGVFPNVGMPNVLAELQGTQELVCPSDEGVCNSLELIEGTGSLGQAEFDQVAYDLSNFLYYVGEPTRLERQNLGVYVLIFLLAFYFITRLLAREYRKEVKH